MIHPEVGPLPSGFFDRWAEWFPDAPAVGFLLRDTYPDRGFRIHSLPSSRRYPASGWDHAELLRRHNAVATDMLGEGTTCAALLYAACDGRYASSLGPDSGLTNAALPRIARLPAALWDEDTGLFVEPVCLFGGATEWRAGAFNAFIGAVADDRVAGLLVSLATGAVYAPYDGGADLFFPTSWERDLARERYANWLSSREDGL
jgi:hypothetical protein